MSYDVTDRWKTVRTLDEAKRMILDSPQPFDPDDLDKLNLQGRKTILDFGCGVGRNLTVLLKLAPSAHIIGYDYPMMLEQARKYLQSEIYEKTDWIIPPPENLKAFTYDFILAILVFQHIAESELRIILPILQHQMSANGQLWVSSR